MQSSWSLFSTWLFTFWPSIYLSSSWAFKSNNPHGSSSSAERLPSSAKRLFNSFHCHQVPRTAALGSAWLAVLQATGGLLPWLGGREAFRHGQRFNTDKLNNRTRIGEKTETPFHSGNICLISIPYIGYGHILGPTTAIFSRFLSVLLSSIFGGSKNLSLPSILAVTTAVMPPLENFSYKLVPTSVDVLEEGQLVTEVSSKEVGGLGHSAIVQESMMESKAKASILEDVVVEPKTGLKFPMLLTYDDCSNEASTSSSQVLAGVGVRSLTVVRVKSIKIYAFGFYVRPDCLQAQLGEKYGIVPPEELKSKSSFYEDLLRHELEMTIRLVVHYKGLKMKMVRSAFETSLRNRLKKIKGVGDDEGLRIFCSYFDKELPVSQGTVIDFRWQPGGQLKIEIEGRTFGSIISHDLCRAFFDLYIGDPPVSPKAKQDIGEKLAHMLRTG